MYREIQVYETCCQKEQVSKLGRVDPGLNLNHVPDQIAFPSQLSVDIEASHDDCNLYYQ